MHDPLMHINRVYTLVQLLLQEGRYGHQHMSPAQPSSLLSKHNPATFCQPPPSTYTMVRQHFLVITCNHCCFYWCHIPLPQCSNLMWASCLHFCPTHYAWSIALLNHPPPLARYPHFCLAHHTVAMSPYPGLYRPGIRQRAAPHRVPSGAVSGGEVLIAQLDQLGVCSEGGHHTLLGDSVASQALAEREQSGG